MLIHILLQGAMLQMLKRAPILDSVIILYRFKSHITNRFYLQTNESKSATRNVRNLRACHNDKPPNETVNTNDLFWNLPLPFEPRVKRGKEWQINITATALTGKYFLKRLTNSYQCVLQVRNPWADCTSHQARLNGNATYYRHEYKIQQPSFLIMMKRCVDGTNKSDNRKRN